MFVFIAVFIGLALIMCMGLLKVLKELIDAKTSSEGASFSEFNAINEAACTIGGDRYDL
jgi:hypothetical protein